jgi:hypothetical protein
MSRCCHITTLSELADHASSTDKIRSQALLQGGSPRRPLSRPESSFYVPPVPPAKARDSHPAPDTQHRYSTHSYISCCPMHNSWDFRVKGVSESRPWSHLRLMIHVHVRGDVAALLTCLIKILKRRGEERIRLTRHIHGRLAPTAPFPRTRSRNADLGSAASYPKP